jgi:head-tail adaptor
MAYERGYLHNRVTIKNKVANAGFGETTSYAVAGTMWANKGWKHGAKGIREGALDAYDKVLFRGDWNSVVKRDSLLVCDGKTYQVLSLDGDFQENKMEILAQEIV